MEKNKKILILIGIPAAGKSTWAKEFVRNNPDWVRINRDQYRLMLKDAQLCEPKIEDLITETANNAIRLSLKRKLNVIIDATHLRVKYIEQIIEEFKYDADIDYRVFDISLEKAIERDKNREAKVGEEVIKKMYTQYKTLIDSFHFQPQKKIQKRPVIKPILRHDLLPNAVIVDIDGTISIMGDRGAYEYELVELDDVNHIVVEHIEFHRSKGRKIILLSGRDSRCRKETLSWLNQNGIYHDLLFMRKEGDYRKDSIIKKEIYDNEIKDKFNVLCCYDDRLQILEMWYKEGLFTFNINQGNIIF